jgi:hypothetical protein
METFPAFFMLYCPKLWQKHKQLFFVKIVALHQLNGWVNATVVANGTPL